MTERRGPKVVRVAEAPSLTMAGDGYRILADSKDTAGRYMVMHAEVPPGAGPRRHVHSSEDEGFYVIAGEVTFEADDEVIAAGPGSFVNLPPGTPHRFRNRTAEPAEMLIFCAPGGIEEFFRAANALGPENERSPKTIVELAEQYGIRFV